jgi:hypothetical protein
MENRAVGQNAEVVRLQDPVPVRAAKATLVPRHLFVEDRATVFRTHGSGSRLNPDHEKQQGKNAEERDHKNKSPPLIIHDHLRLV